MCVCVYRRIFLLSLCPAERGGDRVFQRGEAGSLPAPQDVGQQPQRSTQEAHQEAGAQGEQRRSLNPCRRECPLFTSTCFISSVFSLTNSWLKSSFHFFLHLL